jgi:hypothetical protein
VPPLLLLLLPLLELLPPQLPSDVHRLPGQHTSVRPPLP